jgi:CHAT domain-containing protein/tetratricopeptide (TPR) repeat protein
MDNESLAVRSILLFTVLLSLLACRPAQADPVTEFIVAADSLSRLGDEEFAARIAERSILVGAAVGQLLDAAFETGEGGDRAAEEENVAFAERVALVHESTSGSTIPIELVRTYRGWTADQRAARLRAKGLEAEASSAQDSGDIDAAVAKLEEALDIYRSIDDRRSAAVVWGSLGVAHWYGGDFAAVLDAYEHALEARRAIEDRILEGKTLNGLGSANVMTGEFGTAIAFYQRAIALRRRTGDIGGLVQSLNYLGMTMQRVGRLAEAVDIYEEVYAILGDGGDPLRRIELLNGIAGTHESMGRLRGAEEAYREAVSLCHEIGDIDFEAYSRLNLADFLRKAGRYKDAIHEIDVVNAMLSSTGDSRIPASFYRNRGILYMNMGELEQARDDLLQCLELTEGSDDLAGYIQALINLGCLFLRLGAFEEGLVYAEQALSRAEEAGDAPLERDAVMVTALLVDRLGRFDDGLALYERAAAMDTEMGMMQQVLMDEVSICVDLAELGRNEEARTKFGELLPIAEEQGLTEVEYCIYFGMGHTYEKTDPDSSAMYYDRALELLDLERASIGGSELRTGFLSGGKRHYYEEVGLYYAARAQETGGGVWADKAFRTVERAKARGLLDLLGAQVAAESSHEEEAVLDSIYRLDTESPDYREQKMMLENRYVTLREERTLRSLGGMGSQEAVVGLSDIMGILPKKTVMLAYAVGDTTSMLWAVDRDHCECFLLPGRREIRADITRLRDAIGRPGRGDMALVSASRDLYETLVEPAEERLEGAETLLIVPDGMLFECPFEVLLASEPVQGGEWNEQPFLGRSYTTIYAPSASVYSRLRGESRRPKYSRELLAIGDPDFSVPRERAGRPLEELPHSRTEIDAICSLYVKSKISRLCGAEATESNLESAMRQEKPRILHFATHGLVDPSDPSSSCIALSCDSLGTDDGYLHTLEILSMPFDVELVVLSACESARGRVSRGEGVVGLGRAFMASGAEGVVASLWAVSDESTARLMSGFYECMVKDRKPAAEAMREARLALLESDEFSHPFYWSPFVVIGTETTPHRGELTGIGK